MSNVWSNAPCGAVSGSGADSESHLLQLMGAPIVAVPVAAATAVTCGSCALNALAGIATHGANVVCREVAVAVGASSAHWTTADATSSYTRMSLSGGLELSLPFAAPFTASAAAAEQPVGAPAPEPTESSASSDSECDTSPPPRIYKPCVVCSDKSSGCASTASLRSLVVRITHEQYTSIALARLPSFVHTCASNTFLVISELIVETQ